MARRSVVIDYIDEIPEIRILPAGRRYEYVSCEAEGPLCQLMWCEVLTVLKDAKLTALEAGIVDCYYRGFRDRAIAEGYNKMLDREHYTRNSIKSIRLQAFKKLRRHPDLGVLTELLDVFPKRWVVNSMSEKDVVKYGLD